MDISQLAHAKYAANTPTQITPAILEFAKELGGTPEYARYRPLPFAKPYLCFHNCDLARQLGLGTPVLGWGIWVTRNLWLTAEYHAVLKTESGLLDITPTPDSDGRVLFVPDGIEVFDHNIDEVERHLFSLPAERLGAYKLLVDHPLVVEAVATLENAAITFQRTSNSDWDAWEKEMDTIDRLLDAYYEKKRKPFRKVLRAKKKAERQRRKKARH